MKDNYSWLDDCLKYVTLYAFRRGNHQQPINPNDDPAYLKAKQTIISQIEIEKLRAEIGELELLVVQQVDVGKLVPLSVIIDRKATLTEKLKELEG